MPLPSDAGVTTRGSATLRLHVTAAGDVASAAVASSSGSPALDSAFADAARQCKYVPAYSWDPVTHQSTNVDDDDTLGASWPEPAGMVGPLRCFTPGFPHQARRLGEEGTIFVEFRINAQTGALETRWRDDSSRGSHIRALSIRAVQDCVMNHAEVRASLRPGAWYAIPYAWRLE